MSGALDSAGRPWTLKPGAAAVMLTESAGGTDDPVTVINPGDSRVWLAGDGSAGPSYGVPLDPGTSTPWSTPGQLWASLDPAATAPNVIITTTAIDDWTPSPSAIAAKVAAQLLLTGVPNVLVEKAQTVQLAAGAAYTFDVSSYASVAIAIPNIQATANRPFYCQLDQYAPDGTQVDGELQYSPTVRLAVSGTSLKITNKTVQQQSVTVVGSNRPTITRVDARYRQTQANATSGVPCPANGQGTSITVESAGGMRFCYFAVAGTGTSTLTGYWSYLDALGTSVSICDTAELLTISTGRGVYKLVPIPAGATILFRCVSNSAGLVYFTSAYGADD